MTGFEIDGTDYTSDSPSEALVDSGTSLILLNSGIFFNFLIFGLAIIFTKELFSVVNS